MILNGITKDISSSFDITKRYETLGICIICPDQYPDGKPIDPSDKLTELNDKGEWVCGECKIEEFNKHKMLHWDHNTPMLKHLFKRR